MDWQPIETAPKDGTPILAWCNHEADPYVEDEQAGRLTTYGGHCEGLAWASNGYNVVEWGGETSEYGDYNELLYIIPDWWFVVGSEFEVVANPIYWAPLPAAPDDRLSEEIIREDRDAWPDHQANDPIRTAAGEGK